jgi:tRNA threonylcarbamoyladenosine biosynthesis protein TsaB|tara:strand:+ start:685 stop:1362 length:678 start_codon:yes stop_codon:yes gene_type:complete
MKILAIETATEACSAALEIDNSCMYRHEIAPRKHTELILPMIDSLLKEADIKVNSLDVIALGCGPGAFTGVRIAIGIAQGLAFPFDIPVIPVSTLAALAQQFSKDYNYVATAIDARMKEIYWGLYKKNSSNIMEEVIKESVCLPSNISSPTKNEWFGAGTGWKIYSEEIRSKFKCNIIDFKNDVYPHAKDIIELAKPAYRDGKFISAEQVSPIYLRNNVVNQENR